MNPTVVIITHNEENIISQTLEAVADISKKIVIVDSFSTDNTCEIARNFGVDVYQRKFDDYSSQRNFALSLIDKNSWVLMLDADEILSKELIKEIRNLQIHNNTVAYYIKRVDVFCDKTLRYASESRYFPRLFRSDKIKISRSINEVYEFIGQTKKLKEVLLHYSFNKGIQDWMVKHVRYAKMEADLIGENPTTSSVRQRVKRILYRSRYKLPILFCYYVLIRRGFLDGKRGLLYIYLKLSYERNIKLIKCYDNLN